MVIRETSPTAAVLRAVAIGVAAAAAVSVLAGCGGSSSTSSAAPAAAAKSSTVTTPQADSSDYQLNTAAAPRSGSVPSPDDSQRMQLVYILEAVNPKVSTDEDALVKKSVTICGRMLAGDSNSKITAQTRQAFSNGSWAPSPAETQAMDMAITASFCR